MATDRASEPASVRAVGVDGCRSGWVAAIAFEDGLPQSRTELRRFSTFERLAAWRRDHVDRTPVVAMDVPIGLPSRVGYRTCDDEARRILGKRWACVFQSPDRGLFGLSFPEVQAKIATRRASEQGVRGLSRQGHGIMGKIAEVDRFVRSDPGAEAWLVEVHPEVSLRTLAGEDMPPKKKRAGRDARLKILTTCFDDLEERYEDSPWLRREVARDDILDAYAALWSALRFRRGSGKHAQLGPGERDDSGVLMRIVV